MLPAKSRPFGMMASTSDAITFSEFYRACFGYRHISNAWLPLPNKIERTIGRYSVIRICTRQDRGSTRSSFSPVPQDAQCLGPWQIERHCEHVMDEEKVELPEDWGELVLQRRQKAKVRLSGTPVVCLFLGGPDEGFL